MFEIHVDTRIASVKRREKITAGSVGIQCNFAFSGDWDGLGRVAVFETDKHKISVELFTPVVTIPWEVCEEAGLDVIVGVYGTNRTGTIVIPTIYAKLGTVSVGTTTEGAENAQAPTSSDVQQIMSAAAGAVNTANNANSTAAQAVAIAQSVEARANAGEFDGEDGYSPVASVYRDDENKSVTVVITDKDGTHAATVFDGKKGDKGDRGEKGERGETGARGEQGARGADGRNGIDGKDGINGINGKDGDPGTDGYSPSAKVERTSDGAIITITDKTGTTSVKVNDGQGGGEVPADLILVGNTPATSTHLLVNEDGTQIEVAELSDIPTMLSQMTDDSTHRTVTDAEKAAWSAKSSFDGNYNSLSNKPTIPAAVTESTVSGWGFTKSTDAHINDLIDAKLGVIENGTY